MKNTLLLQLCMLLAFIAKAQIVHEHSYFTNNLSLVKLEFSGYKYAVVDTYIHLYNLDHSLYKQIAIPAQPEMGYCRIGYVTEKLFNTDSTDIEYLLVGSGSSTPSYIKVYSEQGATLFSKDLVGQYSSLGINAGGIIQETIFNTSEGAKMRLVTGQGGYIDSVHIFSLPGYLECSPCGQQSGIAGISGISANAGFLSAAPNPANSFTRITYKIPDGANSGDIVIYSMLGQELKRYPVNKVNEYLTLSLMDLATGTYLYSLQVEGKQPTAKQIVVIR